MNVIGKVTKVNENKATVVVQRTSACGSCHSCAQNGSCHAQLTFGKQNQTLTIEALNEQKAHVGDTVEISSPTTKTLFTMLVVFVVPIILTVVLYFAIQNLFLSENTLILLVVFSFIVLFAVCLFATNLYAKRHISPTIVKILQESKTE